MASEVSICNQALSWLGGRLIISLDDESTEAKLCKANYASLRDVVLEEGKWTFATRRYKLIPSPDEPVYGYAYKFEIPNDVLTIFHVTDNEDNKQQTNLFDWRREENYIVADSSQLFIKAVVRITETNRFTKTFTQALAARIAAEIAIALTESQSKEQAMWVKYFNHLGTALAVDGLQGQSDRVRTRSRIIRNR